MEVLSRLGLNADGGRRRSLASEREPNGNGAIDAYRQHEDQGMHRPQHV